MMTRLRNMLTAGNVGDGSEPANSALAQLFRSGVTLETERLVLRTRTFLDTDGIFEIDSDEEICRLSLGTFIQSKAEARRRVELEMAYVEHGHPAPWSVVRREDRQFIGTCGIVGLNDSADTVELGLPIGERTGNKATRPRRSPPALSSYSGKPSLTGSNANAGRITWPRGESWKSQAWRLREF